MDTLDHSEGEIFQGGSVLAYLTADIVAAYVSHNSVRVPDLVDLISSVHASISSLGRTTASSEPEIAKASAAEIRRSIKPDGIISFIDGKPYKSMKRHLSGHGITPDAYRAKYGLPHDYPMVAASYSAARSALAMKLGLGQMRRSSSAAKVAASSEVKAAPAAKKRPGRPRKTS